MRLKLAQIGAWFDSRLRLAAPIRGAVEHPIPRNTASWWYVFGSAAMVVFALQFVTGILLALVYVPSAGEAWSSLQALNHQIALGWFIRAMHGWGSNFMVAIVLIHMTQVTLSRFFALHVFLIPGIMIGCVALHVLMVITLGINEWPVPGRLVRRATYIDEYHGLTRTSGAPFWPYGVWKDVFFAAAVLLAVAGCAFFFGPFGPTGQPDPTIIQTAPRPDYFFLWLYALLSLLPPSLETPFLLVAPVVGIVALLLLPFLSGEGEKSWRRRPIAVVTVLLIAVTLGTFTRMAEVAPWSPHMDAWSGDPVPDRLLKGSTALERQGALVFQVMQCRNCHSLGHTGGERGPALDEVAVRLTQDQLIRQVIQGGGNMPAYGKNLSPAQTTALVAFLETLHPAGQKAARDLSRDAILDTAGESRRASRP